MKKRVWIVGLILCLGLLLCGFDREQQKVYDEAGLFSSQEWSELQEACVETAQQEKLDIVILTREEPDRRSVEEIADDFYDENGFGYEGAHESGVILLIDMYQREFCITTSGYAMEWFTDREIEEMYDRMEGDLRAGDYYGACFAFLNQVVRLKGNSEKAENGYYDPAKQTFVSTEKGPVARAFTAGRVLLRLLLSAVIGVLGALTLKKNTEPRMSVGQRTYLKDQQLPAGNRTDRFLRETTIHRKIPRPPANHGGGSGGGGFSSTHTSGGGFSHGGGGGRRF